MPQLVLKFFQNISPAVMKIESISQKGIKKANHYFEKTLAGLYFLL
jgi:hypothetical protein